MNRVALGIRVLPPRREERRGRNFCHRATEAQRLSAARFDGPPRIAGRLALPDRAGSRIICMHVIREPTRVRQRASRCDARRIGPALRHVSRNVLISVPRCLCGDNVSVVSVVSVSS
jgi:hypothetical protein